MMNDIEQEGYNAYLEGKELSQNPYFESKTCLFIDFNLGWLRAKKQHKLSIKHINLIIPNK